MALTKEQQREKHRQNGDTKISPKSKVSYSKVGKKKFKAGKYFKAIKNIFG